MLLTQRAWERTDLLQGPAEVFASVACFMQMRIKAALASCSRASITMQRHAMAARRAGVADAQAAATVEAIPAGGPPSGRRCACARRARRAPARSTAPGVSSHMARLKTVHARQRHAQGSRCRARTPRRTAGLTVGDAVRTFEVQIEQAYARRSTGPTTPQVNLALPNRAPARLHINAHGLRQANADA